MEQISLSLIPPKSAGSKQGTAKFETFASHYKRVAERLVINLKHIGFENPRIEEAGSFTSIKENEIIIEKPTAVNVLKIFYDGTDITKTQLLVALLAFKSNEPLEVSAINEEVSH